MHCCDNLRTCLCESCEGNFVATLHFYKRISEHMNTPRTRDHTQSVCHLSLRFFDSVDEQHNVGAIMSYTSSYP